MATMKDVAKLAGVSTTTVSRVINNKSNVNSQTRELIEKAIKELNFKPNLMARSLYNKKSNIIGVIIPHINTDYYSKITQYLDKYIREKGFKMMICTCGEDPQEVSNYLDLFIQYNVEGIVLAANPKNVDEYDDLDLPIVTIDRVLNEYTPSVSSNNIMAGNLVADYFISKNFKNVLILSGPSDLLPFQQKNDAILNKLTQHNIKFTKADFDLVQPDLEEMYKIISQEKYDAVFAEADIIGITAYRILKDLGYLMPSNLEFISYDDHALYTYVRPAITTIGQDLEHIAEASIDALCTLINDTDDDIILRNEVDVIFIKRETTK